MDMNTEAFSISKKTAFMQLKNFCKKRPRICAVLSTWLIGIVVGFTFVYLGDKVSTEAWFKIYTITFITVLFLVFLAYWREKMKKKNRKEAEL